MLQNRHDPTHPQPVVPAVTLPPPHRPTGRRLPNASPTRLVGGTAGGSVGRWNFQWYRFFCIVSSYAVNEECSARGTAFTAYRTRLCPKCLDTADILKF